ncbi:expressed unknown protein [Seminavis robusta]|uniref:G-protein coupled receptors family 1 profile domain-containing protein n=1 Tax=Seminavis robusta TaxID=568900 RepID=A0A9N8HER2_9STRA|nr:expressed unknown protein [Seminavis robusta]|eukprot:Sro527_g160730.1 n/a (617) ;mRNA; r:45001-46851
MADDNLSHIKYSEDISSLSDAQDMILAILPIIPALLSATGSAAIIHMVLTSARKTPYRRIMMGLSCYDLLSSLMYPLQAFLLPRDTSQRLWAIGNRASCSMLGFFIIMFFSAAWYSGTLSCYFCLTVKFGVRERDFAKRYEPYMHAVSIGYPLLAAIVGLSLGTYHEIEIGASCGVTNWPEGCGCREGAEEECCLSPILAWVLGGIPLFLIFCTILVNNLLVFCHVRNTIAKSRRFMSRSLQHYSTATTATRRGSMNRRASFTTAMSRRASLNNSMTELPQQASPARDAQTERIRSVAIQAFLYVASFFITQSAFVALRIMESRDYDAEDEDALFPLLVLQTLTLPSQGIMNCLIYARPGYLRARKEYPNESRFWAFRRALHGDKVQPSDDDDDAYGEDTRTRRGKNNDNNTTTGMNTSRPFGGLNSSKPELVELVDVENAAAANVDPGETDENAIEMASLGYNTFHDDDNNGKSDADHENNNNVVANNNFDDANDDRQGSYNESCSFNDDDNGGHDELFKIGTNGTCEEAQASSRHHETIFDDANEGEASEIMGRTLNDGHHGDNMVEAAERTDTAQESKESGSEETEHESLSAISKIGGSHHSSSSRAGRECQA